MKKNLFYISAIAAVILGFATSCSTEHLDPVSVIRVSTAEKNAFDEWLEINFRLPYNIDFKYRYEMNESDLSYYTIPCKYEDAIVMAHLVQHLCVETYNEVAGVDFTRTYFPKMFFCIGEWEYNNNGTIILGTAEGGKKIMLSGLNYLADHLKNADDLNHYYIKTIHHEFTHIMNQTKDYSTDFKQITAKDYVADSWSDNPYNKGFLQRGFITAYSQHSDTEDFAEMLSEYVTHTPDWWKKQIKDAKTEGAEKLNSKLDIVRSYMKESYSIDIDELRATINRRESEVINNQVDLSDITIK